MDLLQKYVLIIAKKEIIFQVGILFLKKVPHLSKIFVYIHHRNLSRNVANFNQKRQISELSVQNKVKFCDKNVTKPRKKFDKNAKNFDKPIAFWKK
jgi:hypothetical protein